MTALPSYELMLKSYHEAFASELKERVAELPLAQGDQVLDMGCGDGVYSGWLAEHVAPAGRVTAVDASKSYLKAAQRALRKTPWASVIRFIQGDIRELPFADDTFDLAWCAQSLYSFPDPIQALAELRRVVKPGGLVAILENDSLHQLLLPWPADFELRVRQAELAGFRRESAQPEKFYIGRDLETVMAKAGLRPQKLRVYTAVRQTPLGDAEKTFIQAYLKNLIDRVRPHLSQANLKRLRLLTTPSSPAYLLKKPYLTMTLLDHIVWGKKPA